MRNKLFLMILLLGFATSCKHKDAKQSMPTLSVQVAAVESKMLKDKISFSSSVEPLYTSIIEPRIAGYLTAICFDDGEKVKKGDLLFEIDPVEYSTSLYAAEAGLRSAEAEERLAYRNYQRAIPLAEIDAMSKMQLDQYKASYESAVAAVKSAKQAVKTASLDVGYTKIYSPTSGLIAHSGTKEGDFVGVGTEFETLSSIDYLDTVNIKLPIPSKRYLDYINTISVNEMLSDIEVILANGESYPFEAEYDYTQRDIGGSSASVSLVVRLYNPQNILRSGNFVRVNANIGKAVNRLLVPQTAVSQMQGINSVWVLKADSTVSLRRVALGDTYGEMWEIASGLEEGENVLTSGQMKIREGARVKPIKELKKI